jgi:sulfur carrier protein
VTADPQKPLLFGASLEWNKVMDGFLTDSENLLMPPDANLPADADAATAERVAIVVNGEPMTVPAALPVTTLLEQLGLAGRPLAVEINRQVVPRRELGSHRLSAGDALEIVTLVGGG